VPFLDAKALETDPDGMAFLRSVIRPDFAQEQAALARLPRKDPPLEAGSADPTDAPRPPVRSESGSAVLTQVS
jgi:hypothetical protein